MIRISRIAVCSSMLLAVPILGGCQQSATSALPTPPAPVPHTVARYPLPKPVARAPFPASPLILPKPASLGPMAPALITVPAYIKEPMIRVRVSPVLASVPRIPRTAYRGRVEIDRLRDGKFVAVNVVPIESYLAGVLSKELYASWSPRTYRAQAIAARTYALYEIATTPPGCAWNVTGGQSSQVYGGKRGETPKAWHAVLATRGLVMETHQYGRTGIFCAYYSACNGGASQGPQDAWGDMAVRTLPAKRTGTLDSACPKFSWPPLRISKWTITAAVQQWGVRNNLPYLADLKLIRTVAITGVNKATGRPTRITLTDVQGHQGSMRPEEFRLALLADHAPGVPKPLSSFFRIQDAGSSILLVDGHGFGHGIGLSQWGAQALALRGYHSTQILSFYYPGSFLHREWK